MVELGPLLPILAPFIIGFLVGMIIKRGLKLIFPIIALIIVLVVTGAISVGISDIWTNAANAFPNIGGAGNLINVLPFTSLAFIVGFVIGFFKG